MVSQEESLIAVVNRLRSPSQASKELGPFKHEFPCISPFNGGCKSHLLGFWAKGSFLVGWFYIGTERDVEPPTSGFIRDSLFTSERETSCLFLGVWLAAHLGVLQGAHLFGVT